MASPATSTHLVRSLKSFARVASALAVLVGGLVLLGWALDIEVLKSVRPGLTSMVPNTALAFILAGASLGLSLATPSGRGLSYAARACALAVALIGLVSLCEYLFGWDLGIDQILFRDPRPEHGIPPGRMAPATALAFVLVGSALLCLTLEDRRVRLLTQGLAAGAAVVGLVALTGYLFGASSLYTFGPYVSMALHTASLFVVLGAGILSAQPTIGLMTQVTSDSAGGFLARRLLPACSAFPYCWAGSCRLASGRVSTTRRSAWC
jgi:hypothetical protein